MEGMGVKLTSVVVRCLLGPLGMFGTMGLWMALSGLIASPNTSNGGCNLPPAALSPPPHTPPLSLLHTPLYMPLVILQRQ